MRPSLNLTGVTRSVATLKRSVTPELIDIDQATEPRCDSRSRRQTTSVLVYGARSSLTPSQQALPLGETACESHRAATDHGSGRPPLTTRVGQVYGTGACSAGPGGWLRRCDLAAHIDGLRDQRGPAEGGMSVRPVNKANHPQIAGPPVGVVRCLQEPATGKETWRTGVRARRCCQTAGGAGGVPRLQASPTPATRPAAVIAEAGGRSGHGEHGRLRDGWQGWDRPLRLSPCRVGWGRALSPETNSRSRTGARRSERAPPCMAQRDCPTPGAERAAGLSETPQAGARTQASQIGGCAATETP